MKTENPYEPPQSDEPKRTPFFRKPIAIVILVAIIVFLGWQAYVIIQAARMAAFPRPDSSGNFHK